MLNQNSIGGAYSPPIIKELHVNFADIQWFYIISSFVFGGLVGAWIYSLLHSDSTLSTKIRHDLVERELELSQVKENLNEHFSRTATNFSALSEQLKSMEEQLVSDASLLCSDEDLVKRLTIKTAEQPTEIDKQPKLDAHQPPRDYAANKEGGTLAENFQQPNFTPPRDYADEKTGGTLAEDFGLKPEIFEPAQTKS